MRAGTLDRTISIQRATSTVAPAGTVSEAWATVAIVRAELVSLGATEQSAAFGEAETVGLVLRTRYLAGLTTADRVLLDGEAFNLKAIVEIGRRRGLELRIERVK